MKSHPKHRIAALVGALLVSSTALTESFEPSAVRLYPENPSSGDQVFVIVTYPCPYPASTPPKIQRVQNQVLVELATLGNVCLSAPGQDLNREYAFPIGSFGEGRYEIAVAHRVTSDERTFSDYYFGPTLRTQLQVVEGASDLVSGAWVSDQAPGQVLNITKVSGSSAYFNWSIFDGKGDQAWLGAQLTLDRGQLTGEASLTLGPAFGTNDPRQIRKTNWGTVEIQHWGCDELRLRYASALPGFGAGTFDFRPAARPSGLRSCQPTNLRGRN